MGKSLFFHPSRIGFFCLFLLLLHACEDEPLEEPTCTVPPQLEVAEKQLPSRNASDGWVELQASGGNGTSYQFSKDDTLYQRIGRFSNLAAGTYTFFVKDENQCKSSLEVTLEEEPAIAIFYPLQNDTVAIPPTLRFDLFNWTPGDEGRKIALTLDGGTPLFFENSDSVPVDTQQEGWMVVTLALAQSDNSLTPYRDSVRFYAIDSVKTLTVEQGAGSGEYLIGSQVDIVADDPETGKIFGAWRGDVETVADTLAAQTSVLIPRSDITLQATYRDNLFSLTVVNGFGGGNYAVGQEVAIVADTVEPYAVGKTFNQWEGDVQYLVDRESTETTLTMPAADVQVTATFEGGVISYADDVAPLLTMHCNMEGCHEANGDRSDLTTYNNVNQYLNDIRSFLLNGFMPPSGGMTDSEIQTIVDWIDQGALNN